MLGMPFELVDAIDGRITPDLPRSRAIWRHLRNTEVACYLSHVRALKRIVELEMPYGIVLEDDFDYVRGTRIGLAEIQRKLPADLSHLSLQKPDARYNRQYSIAGRTGVFQKLRVCALDACGYLVSQEFAKHVVNEHAVPSQPIDCLYVNLSRESRFNFYDLVQPIICPRRVPTTNQIPEIANRSSWIVASQ
jgi:glycosyl transferase family 25